MLAKATARQSCQISLFFFRQDLGISLKRPSKHGNKSKQSRGKKKSIVRTQPNSNTCRAKPQSSKNSHSYEVKARKKIQKSKQQHWKTTIPFDFGPPNKNVKDSMPHHMHTAGKALLTCIDAQQMFSLCPENRRVVYVRFPCACEAEGWTSGVK